MRLCVDEGFKEGITACCGSERFRGLYSCGGKRGIEEFELWENPSDYLFFDSFHLTEKGYEQLAKLMWSGDSQAIKPYNLKQLFEYDALLASEWVRYIKNTMLCVKSLIIIGS